MPPSYQVAVMRSGLCRPVLGATAAVVAFPSGSVQRSHVQIALFSSAIFVFPRRAGEGVVEAVRHALGVVVARFLTHGLRKGAFGNS